MSPITEGDFILMRKYLPCFNSIKTAMMVICPLINRTSSPDRSSYSDLELMEFFKSALQHEFDFDSDEADYWEEFIADNVQLEVCEFNDT